MKQIILPSTILYFTWLVNDGFMEENGLARLASFKKETRSPPIQKVVKKFEIFPAPSYKTHTKKLALSPLKKNICG